MNTARTIPAVATLRSLLHILFLLPGSGPATADEADCARCAALETAYEEAKQEAKQEANDAMIRLEAAGSDREWLKKEFQRQADELEYFDEAIRLEDSLLTEHKDLWRLEKLQYGNSPYAKYLKRLIDEQKLRVFSLKSERSELEDSRNKNISHWVELRETLRDRKWDKDAALEAREKAKAKYLACILACELAFDAAADADPDDPAAGAEPDDGGSADPADEAPGDPAPEPAEAADDDAAEPADAPDGPAPKAGDASGPEMEAVDEEHAAPVEDVPADPAPDARPGEGEQIIADYMARVHAHLGRIQDAIGRCDEAAYQALVAEFEDYIGPALGYTMRDADRERLQPEIDATMDEIRTLQHAIPPFPDPCDSANVHFPELEYVIDQHDVALENMTWAGFVCDLDVYNRNFDTFASILPALHAMRAASETEAAKGAEPGTTELDEKVRQSRLRALIVWIGVFTQEVETLLGTLGDSEWVVRSEGADFCPIPEEVPARRALWPTPEGLSGGSTETIRGLRARQYAGKTAVELPASVRDAAIAAGISIPPFAELPGGG